MRHRLLNCVVTLQETEGEVAVHVAFKGSSNIQNWLEDVQFVWEQLPWDGVNHPHRESSIIKAQWQLRVLSYKRH